MSLFSGALLLLCAACGDSAGHDPGKPPEGGDRPGAAELIVARGAFASAADQERFEADVLPSARAFLAYWAAAGLDIAHGQARLFVSPPPGTPARKALPRLYGKGIFTALQSLEEEVAAAPSNEAALEVLDAFSCAHPPLHRGLLEDLDDEL